MNLGAIFRGMRRNIPLFPIIPLVPLALIAANVTALALIFRRLRFLERTTSV